MTEERKFAILFAATILAARKLIDMDPNKPNMAKGYFVDRAIDDAAFIMERIDARIENKVYDRWNFGHTLADEIHAPRIAN